MAAPINFDSCGAPCTSPLTHAARGDCMAAKTLAPFARYTLVLLSFSASRPPKKPASAMVNGMGNVPEITPR